VPRGGLRPGAGRPAGSLNKRAVSEESNGEIKARDKRQSQTIDGETGEPDPTPRSIKLSDLRDVRLELGFVYREVDAGRIDPADATKRCYLLKAIADILAGAELEMRIRELEERHEAQRIEAGKRTNGGLTYQH
jgi:hypothetical protein